MTRHLVLIILCSVIFALSVACGEEPPRPSSGGVASPNSDNESGTIPRIRISPAFPRVGFHRPICVTHAGDGSDRVFVVEQAGRIRVFENRSDVSGAEVFLDIREKVRTRHNEEGLLSLVFHPKYKVNGRFLVYYSASDPKRNVIAEYRVASDDPDRADPQSEKLILEVDQPWGNHNGSTLLFGPDGYLYASFGDGGWANDPQGHGQNLATLLATVIRIDVDREEKGKPYAIPTDNPFVNREGARPEIWAYGLRNIWRMSFDRETGDLWGGDVGQDAWEEIDVIKKGENYGWNVREGKHDFPSSRRKVTITGDDPLVDPIVDFSHREGMSVTGGYVYRGSLYPKLQGVYIYGDYVSGKIWGLRYEDGKMTAHKEIYNGSPPIYVASFGESEAGELYICAFDRLDGSAGRILRISAE